MQAELVLDEGPAGQEFLKSVARHIQAFQNVHLKMDGICMSTSATSDCSHTHASVSCLTYKSRRPSLVPQDCMTYCVMVKEALAEFEAG